MRLYFEWGQRQINKHGEELCGDSIAVSRRSDSVALALSDGLGSGVKANISATLTTRIAIHMLENGLPLDEVVKTLSETLPVCQVRKLAYSTFSIGQFFSEKPARLVSFDSPAPIILRGKKVLPVHCEERSIYGKTIHECVLDLAVGDWVILLSDGVLNAGIGGVYPLGWGWDQASQFLKNHAHPELSAQDLAETVAEAVRELYAGAPGDDVSVVVIKARQKRVATLLTGPPRDKSKDEALVSRFVKRVGQLVVCGGTTAKIVSRYLGKPIDVDLATMTSEVPSKARIEGIDLVSEGILTLTRVNELLQAGATKETVKFRTDGASDLLRLFLSVDHVHFIVGQAINPAHQNPELPRQLGIRLAVVREIVGELRKRGAETSVEAA